MTDDLRKVWEAYRQADRAHDAARAHPDRGQKNAKGYAAEGRFHAAVDALQAAERLWEKTRLAYLARKEANEANPT